jgi:hypothetical protein
MKVGAGAALAVGFCWITVAFPSTAAAGEVGWNPFLSTAFCSTCGPQTPLTLEQADAWTFLPTDFLDDILPGPDIFPVEFDAPGGPGGPAAGGGGGSAAPGVGIPGFVDPPSTNSGGGVPGGGGNAGGGNAGGGNAGGLDYGVSASGNNPSGSNGGNGGSNGPQNDVTFTYGDGSTTSDTIDALGDTPGGGGAGQTLVPEPMTLMLLGSGLSAMAIRRRRRITERS